MINHVLSANMEGEGLMSCTTVSHRGGHQDVLASLSELTRRPSLFCSGGNLFMKFLASRQNDQLIIRITGVPFSLMCAHVAMRIGFTGKLSAVKSVLCGSCNHAHQWWRGDLERTCTFQRVMLWNVTSSVIIVIWNTEIISSSFSLHADFGWDYPLTTSHCDWQHVAPPSLPALAAPVLFLCEKV